MGSQPFSDALDGRILSQSVLPCLRQAQEPSADSTIAPTATAASCSGVRISPLRARRPALLRRGLNSMKSSAGGGGMNSLGSKLVS